MFVLTDVSGNFSRLKDKIPKFSQFLQINRSADQTEDMIWLFKGSFFALMVVSRQYYFIIIIIILFRTLGATSM